MLLDPGGHGQNVGVENDVAFVEADLFCQDFVRPPRNSHLMLDGGGLFFLVERHHDDRRAVALDQPRAPFKLLLTLFREIEFTTPFPWTHCSPASMTSKLELSTIMGSLAMSGSEAT